MPIKDQLSAFFKGEVLSDEESLKTYSKDASIFEIKPQIVLSPKDAEDIKSLVKYINNNLSENLSLTPRCAGTCMSGGPINDSIILDMLKHFNQVVEVGDDYAITQPGVFYRDFEKETFKKNLILPCYTSSRELCTVGGMVGNNSAGEKTLLWGQTERYVQKLKVVLSDGEEHILQPLNKEQLNQKMAEDSFEGRIYKRIYELIEENYDLLQSAKPRTSKNSAGYYLWNVWDRNTFDLTKLITGSQGTLGIVTSINFKLVPHNENAALLVISLPNLENLDQIVNKVLEFKPESFECFDDQTIKYSVRYLTDLTKYFKQNSLISVYLQFIPEFIEFISGSLPKLVMLASFVEETKAEAIKKALEAQEALSSYHLSTKIRLDEAMEKYWIIRRNSFGMLKNHAKKLKTAPFIDDIVVQPKDLEAFLPRLKQILDPYSKIMVHTIAGHIGNGNFHIIPLMDLSKKEVVEAIPEISRQVFDLVFEFGGSMAAEHNDGIVRGPFLDKMYGETVYQLFKEIKYLFDPNNIFNPHKKTDATFEYMLEHIHQGVPTVQIQDYAPPPSAK